MKIQVYNDFLGLITSVILSECEPKKLNTDYFIDAIFDIFGSCKDLYIVSLKILNIFIFTSRKHLKFTQINWRADKNK